MAVTVCLKRRQMISVSSGPFKFATFSTDLCKKFVFKDMLLFKINDPDSRNVLQKCSRILQTCQLEDVRAMKKH